ncbi:hypothetical protein N7G274_008955 [Stereocaulon virgatum]|uniref:Uncharacterized protein n=1 Tax=Stereocaulon virgatum TaxID=373712 RepID=A0ABR3ZZ78_9LECA
MAVRMKISPRLAWARPGAALRMGGITAWGSGDDVNACSNRVAKPLNQTIRPAKLTTFPPSTWQFPILKMEKASHTISLGMGLRKLHFEYCDERSIFCLRHVHTSGRRGSLDLMSQPDVTGTIPEIVLIIMVSAPATPALCYSALWMMIKPEMRPMVHSVAPH